MRSFTLLEVLVTLSLLVLLAGLAWPALEHQITASELPESGERVRAMLGMARCEAVMEHRRYRIQFVTEQQQPRIEYEADPINRPNEFEPAPADWVKEPMLLADVQVHEIRPGRPVYLRPLSMTSDPDTLLKQVEDEERQRVERETAQGVGLHGGMKQEEDTDPQRPAITFETDGSSEWATLILARVPPDEPLEEDQDQVWVVLDGRTGIATVKKRVTKEQLSDPKLYVQREKLELPDTVNVDELSFEIGGEAAGGLTAMQGQSDLQTEAGATPDLLQGIEASASDSTAPDQRKGQKDSPTSQGTGTRKSPQPKAPKGANALGSSGSNDPKLEQALQNSDLSEGERSNVRQNFPSGKKSR
jgi:hypothetical protein